MLFDEVTSALDPEVIGEVTNVIKYARQTTHNLTMLMVTHQMGFAKEISDRVCFFFDGAIEEQGTPTKLFENPERGTDAAVLERRPARKLRGVQERDSLARRNGLAVRTPDRILCRAAIQGE